MGKHLSLLRRFSDTGNYNLPAEKSPQLRAKVGQTKDMGLLRCRNLRDSGGDSLCVFFQHRAARLLPRGRFQFIDLLPDKLRESFRAGVYVPGFPAVRADGEIQTGKHTAADNTVR